MYESHFGLRQRPFRASSDSDCYYPATTHERALARLLQALQDDEGLVLVAGDPGTGKTLLCHRLLERLGPEVTSAFLTNSHVRDRAGLLQAILYDLSQPYTGLGEQELRLALTDFLLKNYAEGRRTVILVDEAQHLTADLLEELRLLGNLEARHGKAVQVVLLGQQGLCETLRRPELAGLCQRLAVRIQLEPFSVHEAADYLVHHLRAAGGKPEKVLSDEALEVLARGSQGVPRWLNQAAHQALCLVHEAGSRTVDAEAALEALSILGLSSDGALNEAATLQTQSEQSGSAGEEQQVADGEPAAQANEDPDDGATVMDLSEEGRRRRLFAPPRRSA
jgi:type II secretory pathway predicted ATPase ExeA